MYVHVHDYALSFAFSLATATIDAVTVDGSTVTLAAEVDRLPCIAHVNVANVGEGPSQGGSIASLLTDSAAPAGQRAVGFGDGGRIAVDVRWRDETPHESARGIVTVTVTLP